jgi:putative methylase
MKKKILEMFLQQTPNYINPKVKLEQYLTPATIAADIVFTAYQYEDIMDKTVVDLGCGTGIFAIGAAYANAKKVIGVDIDKDSINQAISFSNNNNLKIDFQINNIFDIDLKADTVLMNPPFGAQKSNKHADRIFVKKALEIGSVVYSLHLTKTLSFIEKLLKSLNAEISFSKDYSFTIKGMYEFHKKLSKKFNVTLLRFHYISD